MTVDHWGGHGDVGFASSEVRVGEGDEFGPRDYDPDGGKRPRPFRVVRILGARKVRIAFDPAFVISGEPIGVPSPHNPVLVTRRLVCLRTRSRESGTDVCLQLVRRQ